MSRTIKRTRDWSSSRDSRIVKRRPIYRPLKWRSVATATLQRAMFLDITVLNGVYAGYGLSFQATGVNLNGTFTAFPGSTELQGLYDAYRIKQVQMTFSYNQNASNPNQNATDLPYLFLVNDYDDVNTITTTDLLQRDAVQMYALGGNGPYGNHIKWQCTPKVAQAAYASAVTTGYLEPKAGQWVSTGGFAAFNDVQHYGTKFGIDSSAQTAITGSNGNLRVFIKVLFEGKHSR